MRYIYLLLLSVPAFVQAQVYKGTIDKYPIVFEVIAEPHFDFNARYYYTKVKENIFLQSDEKEKMVFHSVSKEMKAETFRLKKEGKTLKGTWTKDGKKLAINLALVDTAKVTSNYKTKALSQLKKEELYSYLKLEQIRFNKDREETFDGTLLEWYTEPLSKISCFRIKSSDKIKNIEGVNRFLRERHIEEIISGISCGSDAVLGGGYEMTCKPVFISAQLLSVYFQSGYYCGGVHPDFDSWGVTVDCQSLKKLELKDLYHFGEDFKTSWRDIVKAHFPNDMGSEEEEEGNCNYNDTDVWGEYDWCLTKTGLHVGAYFARSMRSCDTGLDWPIIPYKNLVKYRVHKEKYKLE